MTTMLSLILSFMLSIGGSPAASVNPAGCPGDTGIQAPIDNNSTINHFSEDYNQKTASRANSKKTGESPLIKELETHSSIRFSLFSIEKLRQARYYDHKSYRFNSVDPVINKLEALYNPQSWNLYAYCNNNPITYYDPDGRLIFVAPWLLNPATVTAIIAAATGGAILTHKIIKSIDITDKDVVEAIEGGVDILSKVAAPTSSMASVLSKIAKSDDSESERTAKGTGYNPDGTEKTAAEQLEQLENAQKRFRKNKKQGGKYKEIESTKKSRSRWNNEAKGIKNEQDAKDKGY